MNKWVNRRTLQFELDKLKASVVCQRVFVPSNAMKFVFLCGANKDHEHVSERRRFLYEFAQKHLISSQFFFAEKVIETLVKEGHKKNILDIEHQISAFSDYIIIILESNSAFAELGAFSNDGLRKKLIVINDSKYKDVKSFINLGPIEAIKEAGGANKILFYPMKSNGIHYLDGIGEVCTALYEILGSPKREDTKKLTLTDCDPSQKFDKISAMFTHDLVYFACRASHGELIEIVKGIFGESNFKLREHLAVLSAFGSVARDGEGYYRSKLGKPYLRYPKEVSMLMSLFRNYLLRSFPGRLHAS